MRIAIFFDSRDFVGGVRNHTENVCKNLIKLHQCKIDVYTRNLDIGGQTLDSIQHFYGGNLRIFRCGKKTKFFNLYGRINSLFAIFFLFLKHSKNYKYNIIHAHSPLLLPIGKLLSIMTGIPIVATNHGSNIMDKGKKTLLYYIEDIILTKIKYDCEITVGSNFLKYKNINKPIVIGNGVNVSDFTINNDLFNNKIKKFLFVGRLEWTKGVDILIKAIDILINKKHINNFILNIVGYGYEGKTYKEEVKKLGLDNHIKFKGKIVLPELSKVYSESDLMLISSRTEGFGITILEAMASGVPVISTKCGGPEDIIIEGYNGFLTEKENAFSYAEKINNVLNYKKEYIKTIVNNAYNLTKEKYSREEITNKIYNVYLNIIKS